MTRREWLAALAAGTSTQWMATAGLPLHQRSSQSDPTALSVAELGAAYGAGVLTPLEVTAAYLARIDARNPDLGAYVTVSRDRAVDETRRLLAGRSSVPRGPLFGVPVAHKDLLKTRGVRTAGGSRLYERDVPEEDADLVARCASAGAVLLGKTNTHELGGGVTTINPFFGTTHNPRDRTRIAGGSSGGSAAAVVARLALVSTGSDTGGSIRIPAALCGCVGLKPTFGWLPTTGVLGACPTFDHVGLLTRSAEDAALAFSVLTPARDGSGIVGDGFVATYRAAVTRGWRGVRVGVARPGHFFAGLEPGVRSAIERTIGAMAAGGAQVRDVQTPISAGLYAEMFDPIAVGEIRATYAEAWKTRPDAFSKDFAGVFTGPRIADAVLARALAARESLQRSMESLLADLDVLVAPTVPVVAPRIDGPIDGMRLLQNTWPFNAARVPAVSVPCGADADGRPVGLQLAGAPFSEARLLGFASLVEAMPSPSAAA